MTRKTTILALIGLTAIGLYVTEASSCSWTSGADGGELLDGLSDAATRSYLDYVLSPGKGIFRKDCDKRNALIYIGNAFEEGRPIDFDRQALLTYLGDDDYRGEGGLQIIASDLVNLLDDPQLYREVDALANSDEELSEYLAFERSNFAMYGFRWVYDEDS